MNIKDNFTPQFRIRRLESGEWQVTSDSEIRLFSSFDNAVAYIFYQRKIQKLIEDAKNKLH